MIPRRKKIPVRDVPYTRLQSQSELTRLYSFERRLGKGTYGVVYRATHIETQTEWAIKEIRKPEPGHPRWKLLDNEIEILQKVDHPNIIHLREVLHTSQKMFLAFELCAGGDLRQLLKRKRLLTEDQARPIIHSLADALVYLHRRDITHRDLKLENVLLQSAVEDGEAAAVVIKKMFLAFELCAGGDLRQLLKRKRLLTEDQARPIIHSLADALVYLHRRDITHRDLKLENVLLQSAVEDGEAAVVKVADFGLAVQSEVGVAGVGTLMTQVCGTHTYMAPEVMSGRGYSHSCDVWSVGVIMYMLLCGCAPFNGKSKAQRLQRMSEGVTFPQPVWASVSDTAKTVLSCLLSTDPAHRITAYQLQENPWITGDFSRPVRPLNLLELMAQWCREHAEGSVSADSSPRADSSPSESPRSAQNKVDHGVSQNMNGHNCETPETQPHSESPVDGGRPSQPKRKPPVPRKKRSVGQKCSPATTAGEKSRSRRK